MNKKRSFSVLFVLALIVLFSQVSFEAPPLAQDQGGPDPRYLDTLWVGRSTGASGVDTASGEVSALSDTAAQAVAVDELQGRVWLYGDLTLRAHDFTGAPLASSVLSGADDAPPSLAAHAGEVWLGVGRDLYRFDDTAQLLATLPLPGEVRDLALDRLSGTVYAATSAGVVSFDGDGTQLGLLDVDRGSGAQAVTVDRASGALWVAVKKGLERYADGTLELELDVRGVDRLDADGAGGVWAATRQDLYHVGPGGEALAALEPFDAPGNVAALAAHPATGGVWLATQQELFEVGAAGDVLANLRLQGGSTFDLALYTDLLAPELVFLAPGDGEQVTDPRPALELGFADVGQGVDPASLTLGLGGIALDVSCTFSPATAACTPLADLPEGELTLVANVADYAGNVSAPAAVTFTVLSRNLPPVLAPIGDQTVELGRTLEIVLDASDPNGDPLTFGVSPLPLPGGARFDGSGGTFTYAPEPGDVGTRSLTFTVSDGLESVSETVSVTVLGATPGAPTSLAGRILDANAMIADGSVVPVVGARVTMAGQVAFSGSDGSFFLTGVPADGQVIYIDAQPAAPAPDGTPYASFAESLNLIPGVLNDIPRPFYLPRIDPVSLTTVDPATTTVVENPNLGVKVVVPPVTAMLPDGSAFTGQLSVSEVPEALAPVSLPEAIDPALLVTVQPVGVSFQTPVPVTFPNLDDMPPGSELDLWSVNPETGAFEIVGVGRVSADGSVVETISGGIRTASWHAFLGPLLDFFGGDNNGDNRDQDKCDDCSAGSQTALSSGNLSISHDLPAYVSLNRARGLRLVYNSENADPRPVVSSRTTISRRAAVPPLVSAGIELGGATVGQPVFTNTSGLDESRDETILQALQVDGAGLRTGAYPYRLKLTSHYSSSSVSSFQSGQVLVHNLASSPLGAGWSLHGLQRLHPQADGGMVLSDGNGSVMRFRPTAFNRVFPDFSDLSGFALNGTAGGLGNPVGGNVLRLTTTGGNQRSSAFYTTPIVLRAGGETVSFSSLARVRISSPRGGGADGLAFIITNTPNRLGGAGGGIGYSGVSPSLVVELDTWNNGGIDGNSANHVGINLNGNLASVARAHLATSLENGQVKYLWVDYDGDIRLLEVRLSESPQRPAAPLLTLNVDLPALIGNEGYFGFTAATGGSAANHDVLGWSFTSSAGSDEFAPPPGDFSSLAIAPGGFARTFKDGSRFLFNAQGLQTAAVDTNGNTTTYAYDPQGRLVSITDPVGLVTALDYTGGTLSAVTDPAGRIATFEHDAAGNLTAVTDPDGSRREFSYDGNHRLVQQRSKRGFPINYGWDFAGHNTTVVRADGSLRQIFPKASVGLAEASSGAGLRSKALAVVRPSQAVARYVDGNGNATTFETDRFGASLGTVDASGRTSSAVRDENGNPLRVNNSNGSMMEFEYDETGNLLRLHHRPNASSPGLDVHLAYDPDHNLVNQVTDPQGNVIDVDYDTAGNPVRIESPEGGVRTSTYDSRGQVLTVTNERGHTTSFTYDARGNTETITDARGTVTRFDRDAAGNVLTITEAVGLPEMRQRHYAYDTLNRVVSITDARGAVSQMVYDASGNVVESRNPTGEVVRRFFDAQNRLLRTSDPIRGVTEYGYDANGNVTRSVDALGQETRFFYDTSNRLVRTVDALGGEHRFTYDAAGNMVAFQNAKGQSLGFAYDAFNRIVGQTDSLGRQTTFTYDERNFLVERTDPKGQVFSYVYDALGRLTESANPDGTVSLGYDEIGNLLSLSDSDSTLQFTYDELNRLLTTQVVDVGVQPAVTLTASYDALGRRTRLVDSAGGQLDYAYDAGDNLTRMSTAQGDVFNLGYDLLGRLGSLTLPGGVSENAYDADGRPRSITYRQPGGAVLESATYFYDAVGKLVRIAEGARVRDFSYDALSRLVSGGSAGLPEVYSYDEVGNRVSSFLSASHAYDAANQLLEDDHFTYTYDVLGNMTSRTSKATGDVTSYTWDALGKLVRIDHPDATVTTYRYDARGRRIEKDVDGTATRFVYDGSDLLLELDATDAVTARYHHGQGMDQPLAMERGGETYYYFADHQGSVRFLVDSTGTVVNRYEYDSFGRFVTRDEAVANPFTYTGREVDDESGLYFLRARYYDPELGRFLSRDPMGLEGGDANFYAYVSNDPINASDPSGLFGPWDVLDIISFGLSLNDFLECPSLENGLWLALDTISLLPIIPSLGLVKRGADMLDLASDAGRLLGRADDAIDGLRAVEGASDLVTGLDRARDIASTVPEGKRLVVIGENMERVRDFASRVEGATTYRPWTNNPFDFNLGMQRNQRWIQDMMREGNVIIDIGPDFNRRFDRVLDGADAVASPFYEMERTQLRLRDYDNYWSVFGRFGKYSGGVPGLDF